MTDADRSLGLYIHIPFCASKCPYCDFYSVPRTASADDFVGAVTGELASLSRMEDFLDGKAKERTVDTVYFGGGTPSYIGEERLGTILNAVKNNFRVAPGAEITVECNPSSAQNAEFFGSLKKSGVNRISLGLQSAVDTERKSLGRKAGAEAVKRSAEQCRAAGIGNISLDVMLGIPGQTAGTLRQTLDFALSLGVPHLSAYMLSLEEGTFFYRNREKLDLPDEDAVADLYLFMSGYLTGHGYRHYEISNFCLPGFHSRHNSRYWQDREYLGFGPAAHSFYNGKRFYFTRSLEEFIRGEKAVYDGVGGDAEEYMMLALRLDTGVSLSDMKNLYGLITPQDFAKKLEPMLASSLIRFDGDVLSLTPKGFLISNTVIGALTEEFI